jgi:hypothetical protein
MRLRTALEASSLLDVPVLYWWDASKDKWVRETDVDMVGTSNPEPSHSRSRSSATIKRALFPSTLFESGRRAIRAFPLSEIGRDSTIVLHTSYLAPMIRSLRRAGARRVVIDVYDFVSDAHMDDARSGSRTRLLRSAYGRSVRRRELHYLAQADCLAIAGWRDASTLAAHGLDDSAWIPTGIVATVSRMPEADPVSVGLIGNFAHSATMGAAEALLSSQLATSDACRLVFAGLQSSNICGPPNLKLLGPVGDIREFYDEIHAVAVPVQNSAGMKCKLAEAILAGKTVLTTEEGAVGYPPSLRRHFFISSLSGLTEEAVRLALLSHDQETSHEAFEAACGFDSAVKAYTELLTEYL